MLTTVFTREKQKWLLHMSLIRYSLVVQCLPHISQEKQKLILHMSLFMYFLVFSCIFLLCRVNHSFHKRNENELTTVFTRENLVGKHPLHMPCIRTSWVGFLLWSVYHIFHKRYKNDFSTWVSLGILLLCNVYHVFHKRNFDIIWVENYEIFILFNSWIW